MTWLLWFFSYLIVSSFALKLSQRRAPTYHINNVKHRYTSAAPSHLENAMNKTMILTFETDSLQFSLDLTLNDKIYGQHTRVYAMNDNGEPEIQPRRYRAFLGEGIISHKNNNNNDEIADCSVTFYKDLRFHALCVTSDDTYTIDWKELQDNDINWDLQGPIKGTNTNSGMVLVIKSEVRQDLAYLDDMINSDNINNNNNNNNNRKLLHTSNMFTHKKRQSFIEKESKLNENNNNNNNEMRHNSRRSLLNDQSLLEAFTDCFDGQYQYIHEIYIGIITDTSFNEVYSDDNDAILTAIESLFNDATGANMVYYYQLNIMLTLGTVYIGETYIDGTTTYTYSPATLDSTLDIDDRLNNFTQWRQEYHTAYSDENNGLWHLLTNHHEPPGTVGLAWVGCLCSYRYGTGVSNYINPATSYYGTGTWETFAHEVGHNFGANHAFDEGEGTTGGIMDYGNGLYPVDDGAYQFHPTYNKDEVCSEITASYASDRWYMLIPLANCWHEYDSTPHPSTAPTPPTTANPTSNNPSPTPSPTPSPSDGSDYGYVWYFFGTYTDCSPDCIDSDSSEKSYKTKIYYCATTTTVGSTTYYNSVSDSYCDEGTKPSETVECTTESDSLPSCTGVCGDGLVSPDETCDINGDNGDCCNSDCLSYNTDTIDCFLVNPSIDAIFQDDNGNVYIFQGKYYAKYSSYTYGSDSNSPDDGYPKLIKNSFPISSFTEDITAIAYNSDSEVYVFKNLEYVKIDMSSGEYTGYPKNFNDEFNVETDIVECGKITGAYAKSNYGTTIVAFCDTIYAYCNSQVTFTNGVTSITTWGSDYENKKIIGVYNTPGSSTFYPFTADVSSSRRRRRLASDVSQSIFDGSSVTTLAEADAESCSDANCNNCNDRDISICYSCYSGYVLYGSIKCLSNETLLYLDFNVYSSSSVDHYFVDGGRTTLYDYEYVDSGATGENSTAMLFTHNTKLPLEALNYNNGKYINSFKLLFRFKPYSINNTLNKFMTIDNGNVTIYLKDFGDNYDITTRYNILFIVGNNTFTNSFGLGLTLNEYNNIVLTYWKDTFRLYINGESTSVAYSSEWTGTDVKLRFNEWYIGEDDSTISSSIVGELDQVTFTEVDPSYEELNDDEYNDSLVMWGIIIGASVVAVIGVAICCYCVWKWKNEQSQEKPLSSDMAYFEMGKK